MKNRILDYAYSALNNYLKKSYNKKLFVDKESSKIITKFSENMSLDIDSDAPDLFYRCIDILKIFKKFKIKKVAEIGSGRSSIAFALLSKIYEFKHVAYEQDTKWVEVVNKYISKLDSNASVIFAQLISIENGGFLEHEINNCDLLYIDGPTVKKSAKHHTSFGKPEYYDAINYFKSGIFPKIIMIEGRFDTVELVKNSEYSKLYNFYPEYIYSYKTNNYYQMLFFRRHSFFIKK